MKNKNELALEIMSMCLEYNCDTLHIYCDYAGHVGQIRVRVYIGGDDGNELPDYKNSTYLNATDASGYLQLIINELKAVKVEHDLKYSPEYIESTKEKERLAKIARLQREIDALMNC